jgi:kumamolisin
MKKHSYHKLPGSFHRRAAAGTPHAISKEQTITVTIRLRRKKEFPPEMLGRDIISRETFEEEYAASQEDIALVEQFLQGHNLQAIESSVPRRSVIAQGSVSDFEAAFDVNLQGHTHADDNFHMLTEDIGIPDELKDIITGVFGLDTRPIARPMFQVKKKNGKFVSHAESPESFTPDQLARIYGFPQGVTGSGQCIALIELGGGFRQEDIDNYFKGLNITAPEVIAVPVDGGENSPSDPNGADGEVMLDIEVAGAVAPGAKIAVYFAANTDQGFLDAITQALHDADNKPSVISISWGGAEVNWTQQAMDNFNETFKTAAALGVSICVAAGDSGSSDGETDGKVHVDFPASSPYALACGGTSLKANGDKVSSETVWHDSSTLATGGGVSTYFALPDYQQNAKVPAELDTKFKGRGVPDVAGNADPDTGYNVLVDGQQMVIGGTSAVAPLMAGLLALLNQQSGKPAGFIHPTIYATPELCRDITSGNNKTTSGNTGYTAGKGWDACTGLGVLFGLGTQSAK